MDSPDSKKLLERIHQLEAELKTKDQDLRLYRDQSSKLNVQVQDLIKSVEKEVELAKKIHRLLVPTEIPTISGFDFSVKFEASLISGGDYYDIFELQDKFNFGILLSSASGHSISALFLSILLSMGAKNESKKTASAGPLVESLIKEILGSASEGSVGKTDTANLFYSVIDRRRFQVSYVHLGNMPLLYLPYGEKEPQVLEPTGPVIELGYKDPVTTKQLTLNPRDKLVLASPGIVNNTNEKNESFGLERFYRSVIQNYTKSTHDLRHALLYELQKFIGPDREIQRDVTVLVVEVQDRVIKLAR